MTVLIMKRNIPLLRKTMEHIEGNPEYHYQGAWIKNLEDLGEGVREHYGLAKCGTAYCFAGHATILNGGHIDKDADVLLPGSLLLVNCRWYAISALGISYDEGGELFDAYNTRESLRRMVDLIIVNPHTEVSRQLRSIRRSAFY